MTQFELRFQDLLRHGDWEVINCAYWYGEIRTDNCARDYVGVRHRSGGFVIALRPVLSDVFDKRIRMSTTRSERKQLSKFAREVVRLNLLKSAFTS